MEIKQQIAGALLDIGAIGFRIDDPITFKSGIKSPVYVDNRRFPFNPVHWHLVIEVFKSVIQAQSLDFDVVAGIESAGIPHSATLGFVLEKPSVFVRKQVKDHGTKIPVEGGDVTGKTVLLIEDHISTGMSSLHGVEALRAAGATVTDLIAITSYEFAGAKRAFTEAGITVHTLTTFDTILTEAVKRSTIAQQEQATVKDWLQDPHGWADR